jgi:hypothetical protein
VNVPTVDPGAPPFPSRFTWRARERTLGRPLATAIPQLAAQGLALTPGQIGAGPFGEDVWWLAAVTAHSFTVRTTELRGRLDPEVTGADLLLVVCRDLRRRPPGPDQRTCAVVADHLGPDQDLGTRTAIGPVQVSAPDTMRTFPGVSGVGTTIRFPNDGMTCTLPEPSDEVVVTVHPLGSSLKVVARDASGATVASDGTGQGQAPVDITLAGAGIVEVELLGGAFEVGLVRICWRGTGDERGAEQQLLGRFPVVRGTPTGEAEVAWEPKVEAQVRTGSSICQLVRYTPPKAQATWSSVRILEWAGTGKQDAGRVGVVRLCGATAAAVAQAAGNAAYASWLQDLITTKAAADEPARKDLLAANTGYTINVAWQWQGWVKSDTSPAPPAVPPSGAWQDGPLQSLRFRTAGTAVTTGVPPAELTDEHDFDPRSLQRYLIGFDPDTHAAPHLLDDTLLVHLAVDHGDQLAALYGRHLQLRLRRTDPPPGSLAEQDHPDDEIFTVVWGPLFDAYRPRGQKRLLDAIREAPCLEEPPLGGTTGEVSADLVPGAWYDLMLLATPAAQPDAEDVVISRAHFQASRYRNEADLLGALGFTVGSPAAFIAPDAIVSAVPTGALQVGDQALDAALVAAGLDPWPLSDQARTSVLWLREGSTWKLAGLLLEAPEPIVRSGRTALAVTGCTYGGVPLAQRCRNLAGTRVLLTPTAPTAVPTAQGITLVLTRTVTDRTGATTSTTVTGQRFAIDVPRSVRMEAGA